MDSGFPVLIRLTKLLSCLGVNHLKHRSTGKFLFSDIELTRLGESPVPLYAVSCYLTSVFSSSINHVYLLAGIGLRRIKLDLIKRFHSAHQRGGRFDTVNFRKLFCSLSSVIKLLTCSCLFVSERLLSFSFGLYEYFRSTPINPVGHGI